MAHQAEFSSKLLIFVSFKMNLILPYFLYNRLSEVFDMPYRPSRLRELRKAKNLSIARLSELSKVSARTIQRLENAKDGGTTPHPRTVERLANALRVKPEALVGGSPPEDSATEQSPAPERVQIGALIAPKARLAYDLVCGFLRT